MKSFVRNIILYEKADNKVTYDRKKSAYFLRIIGVKVGEKMPMTCKSKYVILVA